MTIEDLDRMAQDAKQAWHYTDCEYAGPTLESIWKQIEADQDGARQRRALTTSQALDEVLMVAESDPLYLELLKPTLKRVLAALEA